MPCARKLATSCIIYMTCLVHHPFHVRNVECGEEHMHVTALYIPHYASSAREDSACQLLFLPYNAHPLPIHKGSMATWPPMQSSITWKKEGHDPFLFLIPRFSKNITTTIATVHIFLIIKNLCHYHCPFSLSPSLTLLLPPPSWWGGL